MKRSNRTIAILLSCEFFEAFFGRTFSISVEEYLESYRNDFSWEYANAINKTGNHAIIYVFSLQNNMRYETIDGYSVRFVCIPIWYRYFEIFLFRIKNYRVGSFVRDLIHYLGYWRHLKNALQSDSVDVLYVQEFWTHRFDFLVQNVSIPVIGAAHGADDRTIIAARKRQAFTKAAMLTCQSEEELRKVSELGGKGILLTNSVDVDYYIPNDLIDRSKSILWVGRLIEEQKRVSDLLRALAVLGTDWRLNLVGTGPDINYIKDLAQELGIINQVKFMGFVSDKNTLLYEYQSCGVFALPSAWEAVALVLLEAMSCETAVVATDLPPLRTVIDNTRNGALVSVGDVEALARAIQQAFHNREKWGREARQTVVAHYSRESMIKALASIIADT